MEDDRKEQIRKFESAAGDLKLQSPITIVMIHDMLSSMLSGDLPCPHREDERQRMEHYGEVFCWLVGHTGPGEPGADCATFLKRLTDFLLAITRERIAARVEKHKVN